MAWFVDMIETLGKYGGIAIVGSLGTLWISQHFEGRRLFDQSAAEAEREDRQYSRQRKDVQRDFYLANILELQEMIWPTQELVTQVGWVRTGLDQVMTGDEPIRKVTGLNEQYLAKNNRMVVLIARIHDEELRRLGENCRSRIGHMHTAIANGDSPDPLREKLVGDHRAFQDRARIVISELLIS